MTGGPAFFEPIRQRASKRWDQLENDPELAGPWHQLFKQVQSPRHILSELLQNADDAGATEAAVRIGDDAFYFEHNGEDFTEEHFASLCRFGYSNKRALHTIGFRGIGFKSTFSLGDRVELYTPTLAIAFDRDRFTEPKWISNGSGERSNTIVRVAISDEHRKIEVEKNLKDWLKSPVSLLFFKHIRQMKIGDDEVHWGDLGPGPIKNTEWLALFDNEEKPYLLARSEPENFPADALAEIKQERMLSDGDDADFPPCTIEIVLGVEGRLFVVLPTGVKTDLPFACNAPFVQDPARLKIKDPEISPTNRWLLQRAGKLAASTMMAWLRSEKASISDKAGAYGWLPPVPDDETELESVCGGIVGKAFLDCVEEQELLLTENGDLVRADECIAIPDPLFDVWPGRQAVAILDDQNRPAFSREVSSEDLEKLTRYGLIEKVTTNDFLTALRQTHLPKPESWRQLLNLWCFVDPLINRNRSFGKNSDLRLVPVQGQEVLLAANEVVRLGEKKLLQSDEDWRFLGDRMSVVNQNWLRFLADERRRADTTGQNERLVSAYAVLDAIGLGEPSDAAKVVGQVASDFFSKGEVSLQNAIRIAQIAAKLGASITEAFRYVTQDKHLHSINSTIIFDDDGVVEMMVPEAWSEEHLLHPDYAKEFTSCSREEWLRWVSSGRSGLHSFVPIVRTQSSYMYRGGMKEELEKRGYGGKFDPKYKDPYFRISDWSFDEEIWEYWDERATEDEGFWGRVIEKILIQPNNLWADKLSSSASEYASNGNSKQVVPNVLLPDWIIRLKDEACLKDTHGFYRNPPDLLRRTPETEAVMDVEPFVHPLLDNENTRPLLFALGVGDMPTGPERLLERIKGLSTTENAPAHEVEKWYRRLDQMVSACSTEDFLNIKNAFSIDRLILTESNAWENSQGIYLSSNEEDVPGAEVIRASVRDLTFWRKIGVSERPTADQAIAWLGTVPSGQKIPAEDIHRVRALLARHAIRIWQECAHWINLAGEWCPTAGIEYMVSMQSLVTTRHLHEWVRVKTGNFQDLSVDILAEYPFSGIPPLGAHIEERFHKQPSFSSNPEARSWLVQLGKELTRINDSDDAKVSHIQSEGLRMSITQWQVTPGLETIAYIDGTPAGMPRRTDAMWLDNTLYVEEHSLAKLARSIAQELGRTFNSLDIVDAIKMCVDRDPGFITAYMEENFDLGPYSVSTDKWEDAAPRDLLEGASAYSDPGGSDKEAQYGGAEGPTQETSPVRKELEDGDLPEPEERSEEPKDNVEKVDEGSATTSVRNQKPPIMARYAVSIGYRADGENRFYHADGSWISKADGSNFPWAQYAASGNVIQYFKPRDHCLKKSPLELEAEVWEIIKNRPDSYTLVLTDIDGEPISISGQELLLMWEREEITLFPATYRLVYGNN
jgi:hypothetical protein